MLISVAGSRSITDKQAVYKILLEYIHFNTVVVGDAGGVDAIIKTFCLEYGKDFIVMHPANRYYPELYKSLGLQGSKLYLARDYNTVEAGDLCLAIWDGHSRGTYHFIEYAKEINKPLKIERI